MDWFIGFFANPFNILIGILFLAIGVVVGVVCVRFLMRPRNQILYCRERDGRGLELNVAAEDGVCLETNSSPELRFFKYGRSYEFSKRGRRFTRFLGKEGTAYTWRLQGFSKTPTKFETVTEELPVLDKNGRAILDKKGFPVFKSQDRQVAVEWEDTKVDVEFPTLEDALKYRWGKEEYDVVPESMKQKLRDNSMLVTVNLEAGIVPEGYKPITESVIRKKANEDMAALIGKSVKGAISAGITDWLPYILAGAGIMAIASKFLGWW